MDAAKREAEDLYRGRPLLEIDHVEIWKIVDDVVGHVSRCRMAVARVVKFGECRPSARVETPKMTH